MLEPRCSIVRTTYYQERRVPSESADTRSSQKGCGKHACPRKNFDKCVGRKVLADINCCFVNVEVFHTIPSCSLPPVWLMSGLVFALCRRPSDKLHVSTSRTRIQRTKKSTTRWRPRKVTCKVLTTSDRHCKRSGMFLLSKRVFV